MAAIKTRIVLPASHTIRVLYSITLLFGVNVTLIILRTVAMYTPPRVVLYSDFNVRFPANRFNTIVSAAEAFGCGYVGNGTLEFETEQVKCKRKVLRAALAMDESGALRRCGFQKEYEAAIKGTPLQPLSFVTNPCWMATLDNSDTSPLHKLFRLRLKRGHNWRLRCLPSAIILGSGRSGVTDLGDILALHPQMHGPSQYGNHAWMEQPARGCQLFSRYLDTFDKSAERLRRTNLNLAKEQAVASQEIVFDVAPRYVQGWVSGGLTMMDSNVTSSHLPYLLKLLNPELKLIIMLRDPIKRMLSDFYVGYYSRAKHGLDVAKAFDILVREVIIIWRRCIKQYTDIRCVHDLPLANISRYEPGLNIFLASLYSIHIRNWMSAFPASQMLFIKSDEYYANREDTLNRITRFLKLENFQLELLRNISRKSITNQSSRHFVMWEKTEGVIRKVFEIYNRDLSELLNDGRFTWS